MRHGRTFNQWMAAVDRHVQQKAGVSIHDLPDFPSWDYWASGYEPSDAADEVLAEEGFPSDD